MKRRAFLQWAGLVPTDAFSQVVQPLRIVVPSAPGGSGDLIPRLFAPLLSLHLQRPVVVDNRSGAGGRVGALHVANSSPAMPVLCAANTSAFAIYPSLARAPSYHPLRDFSLISTLVDVPNVLCVNPGLAARTFRELISIAHSSELTYASAGIGSLGHFMGLLFGHATDTVLRHIPYRGAGPALQDVVAGHVAILFDNLPASLPHIKAGRLNPLLVAAPKRLDVLSAVPTFEEAGLQELNDPAWFGLAAPAGAAVVDIARMVAAVEFAMKQEQLVASLRALGAATAETGPRGLGDRIDRDMARFSRLGRRAGITLED